MAELEVCLECATALVTCAWLHFTRLAVDARRKRKENLDGPEACNWAWQAFHAMAPVAHCKSRAKAEKRFVAQCERARALRAHPEANKYVADNRYRVTIRTALPATLRVPQEARRAHEACWWPSSLGTDGSESEPDPSPICGRSIEQPLASV